MTKKEIQTEWFPCEDADAIALEASKRILKQATQAISNRGVFRFVLAGGHTPEATYSLLAKADAQWSSWEIYFGDERCLAENHPDRNSVMAEKTFLSKVPIPKKNIYPMHSEKGAEIAAKEYTQTIKNITPFDLVLLGIGEDGHTGSLFPGQKHPADEIVSPVHNSPKPPSDRVTMGVDTLSNAQEVIILVSGEGKRDSLRAWKNGKAIPIAEIGNPAPVTVLYDKAAQG